MHAVVLEWWVALSMHAVETRDGGSLSKNRVCLPAGW